ncbi:MAG: DUF262 domain-containing HNH endonuclease family protein [Candidatus Methanoperedens sp.]|nr:DUF262 domain-containing HNH endonuclease family protein [Candidatus Methanoperedens sp.]MCZ7403850.1 DUF262 domain-containing HNH endonuclease family protein [Candidatus Methanoperedens sp.]
MEAGKRSINDIFNGNKILEIPFFQRAYIWNESQWERFLTDMEYVSINNKPYFLGSIILKQQLTNSQQSVGDKRTLIDGQQRLTTLNIFFKVLSLKTNNQYFSNIFRLPMKENEIALLHNRNDINAFNSVLNLTEEKKLTDDDNVTKAYNYFSEKIDISKLNFQNILTNIMFVGIDLGFDDDEQQIFDTTNSLGVDLTTADLLKNYLFGRNEIQLYIDHWQNVFEIDKETKDYWDTEITAGRLRRDFIDLFFYSFLQIKIQDSKLNVKAEDKDEFTKMVGLFNSYKIFIKNYNIDKFKLIAEIKEYAKVFQEYFDNEIIDSELTANSGIERINAIIWGLENTTLIPYVLFVLKNVVNTQEQNKIFEYLETYIMRRMVCHENTKNYNQLFSERLISNNILSKHELKLYIDSKSDKVNHMPSDSELKEGFNNSKLVNNQSVGILYFIETKIRDKQKHSTSLLGLDRYSLEHIMPKKWENNWGKLSNEQDKINRNRKLLTLGNLTIITASLNSSIKNGNWDTKRNGKGTKKGLNQYATGLDTFSQYLTLPDWNEQTITNRADFLYNEAVKIWKD